MKIEQRDLICIFAAGRLSADSTEAFLAIHGHSEPKLFIELHSRSHGVIGYAELLLAGREEFTGRGDGGLYELARLLPVDCPCPGPVISLSGVSWPRREVLARFSEGRSSPALAG